MAARLNKRHTADIRAKIGVGVILDRLHKHFMGELELNDLQLKSAKLLLDKSISNAPTEIEANIESKVTIVLANEDVDI